MHEPSVVAIRLRDNKMVAVGHEAYDMLGRTPESIEVARPMRRRDRGLRRDRGHVALFYSDYRRQSEPVVGPIFRPKVMISTPKGVTSVRNAVHGAAMQAGASGYLIRSAGGGLWRGCHRHAHGQYGRDRRRHRRGGGRFDV